MIPNIATASETASPNDSAANVSAPVPARKTGQESKQESSEEEAYDASSLPPPPAIPPADPALADGTETPLYLEVFINGQPTKMIGEFRRTAEGDFTCRARELRELGIKPPQGADDEDVISLKDLGATWEYDETAQRIRITLGDEGRVRRVYDLRNNNADLVKEVSRKDTGLVLNYSTLVSARTDDAFAASSFEGASLNLDGWIYSPVGTISGGAFIRYDKFEKVKAVRLDTAWRYTDMERSISYQIGDMITGGPGWARPVRMAGIMISRNFRLRPDIVTTPLPSLSGSAAVPTTVDVYLNNVKVHSQEVEAGPFTITNIPAISSSGVARLVMRDAAGREIETKKSFYTSPALMRAGMLEFSLAAGLPRLNYGIKSFDYDLSPGGVASARYGVTDRLTVHGHAELAKDLQLAGGGLSTVLFDKLLVSAAGAVSHSSMGTGFLARGSLETQIGNFMFNASTQRIFKDYADLATVSAPALSAGLEGGVSTASDFPRAIDRVTAGYSFPDLGGGLSVSFLRVKSRSQGTANTLSLNWNQRLWGEATLYATAFADLDKISKPNVFVGVNIPLGGGKGSVSGGFNYDEQGKYRATASYSKPLEQKDNSVGWRARVTYGDLKSAQASLAWRMPKATARATVMKLKDNTLGHASLDGALIVAGGGVFASNRVHDSFAIVDVGAPDVTVRYENRPIGKTGKDGKLLITTLRSFDRNKISIDAEELPVDVSITSDKRFVVPADKAGVTVDFNVKSISDAALVTLTGEDGKPLEVSSEVFVDGHEEPFVVGYDGQAWLEGLKEGRNTVRVSTSSMTCEAAFEFTPKAGEQVHIGPVPCKMISDAPMEAAKNQPGDNEAPAG